MAPPLQDQRDSSISKKIGDRNEFLFHAGHLVFATCPQLSRFYLSEFQASLRSQDITLSKAIGRQLCPQCGQLYVAGLNTTVSLEPNRPGRNLRRGKSDRTKRKRRRNVLVYECLACHYKSRLPGSELTIPKATDSTCTEVAHLSGVTAAKPTTPAALATPIPPGLSGSTPHSTSTPVPGNSKKKKKKTNLQAMLASRKNDQNSKSSGSGLGLGDFLSSL